jgi:hypothetical protein
MPNTDNDIKWMAIGVGTIMCGLFAYMAVASFSPDPIAERIAACMTQPGMQFTEDGCLPIPKEP